MHFDVVRAITLRYIISNASTYVKAASNNPEKAKAIEIYKEEAKKEDIEHNVSFIDHMNSVIDAIDKATGGTPSTPIMSLKRPVNTKSNRFDSDEEMSSSGDETLQSDRKSAREYRKSKQRSRMSDEDSDDSCNDDDSDASSDSDIPINNHPITEHKEEQNLNPADSILYTINNIDQDKVNELYAKLKADGQLSKGDMRTLKAATKRVNAFHAKMEKARNKPASELSGDKFIIGMADWDESEKFWTRTKEVDTGTGKQTLTYEEILNYVERDIDKPEYLRIHINCIRPRYKVWDEDFSIECLTKDLQPWLRETPNEDLIWENIKSLCKVYRLKTKTNTKGESDSDYEKPFYIEKNYLLVRRDIIRYSSKNKMEKAVKNIYQHKDTIPSDKIFGMDYSSKEYYHKFKVIRLEKNDKEVILPNKEYVSKQAKELSLINLRDILKNELFLTEKVYTDPYEDISSTSRLVMDFPLASGVFIRHIEDIGWNKTLCETLNIWPELKMNGLILLAHKNQLSAWKKQLSQAKKDKDDRLVEHLKANRPHELKPYPDNLGAYSRAEIDLEFEKEYNDPQQRYKLKHSYGHKIKPIIKSTGFDDADFEQFKTGELSVKDKELISQVISNRMTNLTKSLSPIHESIGLDEKYNDVIMDENKENEQVFVMDRDIQLPAIKTKKVKKRNRTAIVDDDDTASPEQRRPRLALPPNPDMDYM